MQITIPARPCEFVAALPAEYEYDPETLQMMLWDDDLFIVASATSPPLLIDVRTREVTRLDLSKVPFDLRIMLML